MAVRGLGRLRLLPHGTLQPPRGPGTSQLLVRSQHHVAIVGGGPAGFYAAQVLLKEDPQCRVDIWERLPVPFGLVRFGVAPDHPEVKNCQNQFSETAAHDRCSFYGGVQVGVGQVQVGGSQVKVGGGQVGVELLRRHYHATVLAYGAQDDNQLNVPGEQLQGVVSARRLVGWYNGDPSSQDLDPELDRVRTVAVLGHGNVALDVARILLTPLEWLEKTDITREALAALDRSAVQRVAVVGRRGPLNVSFTIKELRELLTRPRVHTVLRAEDFRFLEGKTASLGRPRRRLTELMMKHVDQTPPGPDARTFQVTFRRLPLEVLPSADHPHRVGGVRLAVTELQGPFGQETAVETGEVEDLPCDMVVRSVGYQSRQIDPAVPYDPRNHHVANKEGRVVGNPGLYVCGWAGSPPSGVILTTMSGAFEVARRVVADLKDGSCPEPKDTPGSEAILNMLSDQGVEVVTWAKWLKLDAVEKEQGSKVGKPREKITDVQQMLQVAASSK